MRRFLLAAVVVFSGCATDPRVQGVAPSTADGVAIQKVELSGYIQKVQAKAKEYALKEKLKLRTEEIPAIKVVKSEEELTAIRAKDADKMNKLMCGLCDYEHKTLYILNMDYEALAHEFGHWYFGTDEDRADDFAWFFCKSEKVHSIPILNR